jgi:hypothetical protein
VKKQTVFNILAAEAVEWGSKGRGKGLGLDEGEVMG